jgi:hypothetical protein
VAGRMTACAGVRQLFTTRNLRRGSGDPNVFNLIVEVRVQLSKTNQGENQQSSGDPGQRASVMIPFSRAVVTAAVRSSTPSLP